MEYVVITTRKESWGGRPDVLAWKVDDAESHQDAIAQWSNGARDTQHTVIGVGKLHPGGYEIFAADTCDHFCDKHRQEKRLLRLEVV